MDVVIAGGGPAGAATAIALRRRGCNVIVFDRAAFPRDKVCGDVLLPEAQDTLHDLDLDLSDLKRYAYRCDGLRYVGARGRQIAGEFRDGSGKLRSWWMIRRRDLDAWLLNEARRAGAHIVERTAVAGLLYEGERVSGVSVRCADGTVREISSRVVVGADGASSVVAQAVGAFSRQPEHTCIAGRAYVHGLSLPAPYLEVFTTPKVLPGCAWIVPVGRSEANVGVGVVMTTSDRLARTPQELFEELRAESPLLRERLQGAGSIKLKGWMLPSATERRRLAGPGWLLVGDAGAMVDPFTGHGIQNALSAGRLAAETIANAITGSDLTAPLLNYDRECRAMLQPEVDRGAFLQRVHARPRLVDVSVGVCSRHPGLRGLFLALVGHAATRRSLLSPAAMARAVATLRTPGVPT